MKAKVNLNKSTCWMNSVELQEGQNIKKTFADVTSEDIVSVIFSSPYLCSLQKRRFRCGTSWMSLAPSCSTRSSPAVVWLPSSTFRASWPTLYSGLCRTWTKEVNTHIQSLTTLLGAPCTEFDPLLPTKLP